MPAGPQPEALPRTADGPPMVVSFDQRQVRGFPPFGKDGVSTSKADTRPRHGVVRAAPARMSLAPSGAPQPASPIGWGGALQQGDVLLVGRPFEDGVWRLSAGGRSTLLTPEVESAGRIPAWTVWRDLLYYIYMPTEADSHLPTSADGYLYSRPIAGGNAMRIAAIPSINVESGIAVDPRNGDVVYSRRLSVTQDIGLASLHAQ